MAESADKLLATCSRKVTHGDPGGHRRSRRAPQVLQSFRTVAKKLSNTCSGNYVGAQFRPEVADVGHLLDVSWSKLTNIWQMSTETGRC